MRIKDSMIPLEGRISVRMLSKKGVCVYRYDSPNTITYLAPLVILDLITQGWAGTTSGAFPSNVNTPIADHPPSAARGFVAAVPAVHDARRNQTLVSVRFLSPQTPSKHLLRSKLLKVSVTQRRNLW